MLYIRILHISHDLHTFNHSNMITEPFLEVSDHWRNENPLIFSCTSNPDLPAADGIDEWFLLILRHV